MKKSIWIITILTLLTVSCSKEDDNGGYKVDQVFQESQLIGYWIHNSTKYGDKWIGHLTDTSCNGDFFEFKTGSVFNFYGCNNLMPEVGSWAFDGKNILRYTTKDGKSCQLKLISVSDTEIIAEAKETFEGREMESETRKYKKVISSTDDYYQIFTQGFKVKDISNFTVSEIHENFVTGIKDNKLWVGCFDVKTKEQLWEIKDEEDFSFTKQVHIGYGEYETYTVKNVKAIETCNDKLLKLEFLLVNGNKHEVNYELWFRESGKKISYEKNFGMKPWYNGSYFVVPNDDFFIFTEQGETILTGFNHHPYLLEAFPISYNYYIEISPHFYNNEIWFNTERLINDGNSWSRKELKVETEESNYKYTVDLIKKEPTVWTFQLDITEYSGKKHTKIVQIDIPSISNQ